jgi:hypothetical protein
VSTVRRSRHCLAFLLLPATAIAGDSDAPSRRAANAGVAPVFCGLWHGTWRRDTGPANDGSIWFGRDSFEVREVLAPGNVCFCRERGGITAYPDGSARLVTGGSSWRGIYRVEGARVRLCFSRSGVRPDAFGDSADTFEWLIEPARGKGLLVPVKK